MLKTSIYNSCHDGKGWISLIVDDIGDGLDYEFIRLLADHYGLKYQKI